jgi:lipoprotein NlpD
MILRVLAILLFVVLAGCGVSPRVRVDPVADSGATAAQGARPSVTQRSEPERTRHVVVRGDTLYAIAFRNGLDVRDLISWNRIAPPYTIFPGQALQLGPTGGAAVASNPQPDQAPAAVTPPPATTATVAVPATDDGALGPRAIVDAPSPPPAQPLAETTPPPLAAGSRPAAGQPGSLIAAISEPPKSAASDLPPSPGFKPEAAAAIVPPTPTPTPTAAAVAASTVVSAAPSAVIIDSSGATANHQGLSWRWPTAGQVIGRFVAGDPTQRGIDIAGKLGQPVLAVGDGEVVYSGNGLLGYGEMIIVQHSPDYLSAYGHNQRRLVEEGSKVRSGQRIAEMGQRGSTVMLHFEIRLRGKPVDPLSYLPR